MYIHIKVKAGVKEEMVVKKSDTNFVISVKEPSERNLANKRVVELICEYFKTLNQS